MSVWSSELSGPAAMPRLLARRVQIRKDAAQGPKHPVSPSLRVPSAGSRGPGVKQAGWCGITWLPVTEGCRLHSTEIIGAEQESVASLGPCRWDVGPRPAQARGHYCCPHFIRSRDGRSPDTGRFVQVSGASRRCGVHLAMRTMCSLTTALLHLNTVAPAAPAAGLPRGR